MRRLAIFVSAVLALSSTCHAEEPSVERGLYVSIIGGCHDCHTAGYSESGGKIDPLVALKGSPVGFQGPWGTSYPTNLRLSVSDITVEGFASYLRTIETNPPMPWYKLRAMSDDDQKSLYLYIRSLGEAGDPAPTFVPTGNRVLTPYIILSPPIQPPACTRDLDCGVGEICDPGGSGLCIRRK